MLKEPVTALKRFQSFREITFFLREVGVGPHRGGSSVKVSTKRGRSCLCKLPRRGPVTHLFQDFYNEAGQVTQNTGRSLPKGTGKGIIIAFWSWNPPSETSLLMLLLGLLCAVCVAPKFASVNFS